jgi:carnosine synthase
MARDKHLTRKAVSMTEETQKYGIRSILIENGNVEFLRRAAKTVGFPAVLKPVAGAASLGVQKVGTFDELLRTYDSISALVSNLIVSNGALERRRKLEKEESHDCCLPSGSSKFDNSTILLEEYISGKEVDIDLVLSHGKVTFCEVSDNGPTIEPYFGETYNSCPSLLAETDQLLLKEMAILITTKALGFRSGVFHIEGKMTSNGPRLIEVNCRMGGGPIRAVHLARSGVDLVVEQLLVACGFPLIPPVLQKENLPAVGFINVNARRSGTVACVKFIEQFNERKGMVYCKSLIVPGEHIVGPDEGQPTWLAEAVFSRETAEEAHRDSLSLYNEIQTIFEQNYVTY